MTFVGSSSVSDLFQLLRNGEPRTRAQLANATGLSRSTIGLHLDTLIESGLVTPIADAASTGGRPSARIALKPDARLIAAADLGATHATLAITDLAGKTLSDTFTPLEIAQGPANALDWITGGITDLLIQINRDPRDLAAIGIGLPGPVEHDTGKPSNPPIMPGWDKFDVPHYIQRTFNVPVLVDNDVNIMALGERAASWPDVDNLIFLKVATGIGAGIISSGVLQRGDQGIAGDIGHIRVMRGAGVICRCGNEGCLEAIAGGPAIAANAIAEGPSADSIAGVVALVRSGDLAAILAVRQAGKDIGEVLNMCVSIINPSVIVIGGSMADVSEHLIAGIREVVYARSQPLATQNLTIAPSRTGPGAAILGASLMAADFVLSPKNIKALTLSLTPSRDGDPDTLRTNGSAAPV